MWLKRAALSFPYFHPSESKRPFAFSSCYFPTYSIHRLTLFYTYKSFLSSTGWDFCGTSTDLSYWLHKPHLPNLFYRPSHAPCKPKLPSAFWVSACFSPIHLTSFSLFSRTCLMFLPPWSHPGLQSPCIIVVYLYILRAETVSSGAHCVFSSLLNNHTNNSRIKPLIY